MLWKTRYVRLCQNDRKENRTISLLRYIDPSMITAVMKELNIKYVLNDIQDMCIYTFILLAK